MLVTIRAAVLRPRKESDNVKPLLLHRYGPICELSPSSREISPSHWYEDLLSIGSQTDTDAASLTSAYIAVPVKVTSNFDRHGCGCKGHLKLRPARRRRPLHPYIDVPVNASSNKM